MIGASDRQRGTQSRVFELDFLRGVAVLLVLGTHSPAQPGESGWLRPLDLFLHQFGWSGVDLFFVLSGYLIGGLLFSEIQRYESLDVGRFLVRRMLRIWPAYYILLAFIFASTSLDPERGLGAAWSEIWPCLIHVQNFMGGGPRDQLWSLAVEEHFYLALPLYLWFLTRRSCAAQRLDLIPVTCWVLAFSGVAFRILTFVDDPQRLRYPTHLSLDALFFGVYLAYLKAYKPGLLERVAAWRGLVPVALAAMVPAAVGRGVVRETIGFSGLYLGYGLLLVRFVHRRPGDFRWLDRLLTGRMARSVAWLGTSSYSIYLWHREVWTWKAYEVGLDVGRSIGLPSPITWALHTVLYVVVGVVAGVALERLIEKPVLALRNRVFPARSGASTAAPSSVLRAEPKPESETAV